MERVSLSRSVADLTSRWIRGPHGIRLAWLLLIAGSLTVIFATAWVRSRMPGELLLRPLDLATEQSLGTWWTAVQFLLFSALMLSTRAAMARCAPAADRAGLLLGLIGLALFLDELASMHEQLALFAPAWLTPQDLILVPPGLLGAAALALSLPAIFRLPAGPNRAAGPLTLGFVCFAMIYPQEWLEHNIHWAPWALGPRAAAEEGTELLGCLLLLVGAMRLRRELPRLSHRPQRLSAPPVAGLVVFAATAMLPVVLLRASLTPEQLRLPDSGDFGSTLPTMLFALASLLALQHARQNRRHALAWLVFAGTLALSSAAAQVHFHHYLFRGLELRPRGDFDLLWVIPMLALAASWLPGAPVRRLWAGSAALWLVTLAVAWTGVPLLWVMLPHLVALAAAWTMLRYEPETAREPAEAPLSAGVAG